MQGELELELELELVVVVVVVEVEVVVEVQRGEESKESRRETATEHECLH